MKITSPDEVTGTLAKSLRIEAGLTQREFWRQFDASKCRASYYENGKQEINMPIRHLIYLKYGCGIPVFASHSELTKLGKAARNIIKQRKEEK